MEGDVVMASWSKAEELDAELADTIEADQTRRARYERVRRACRHGAADIDLDQHAHYIVETIEDLTNTTAARSQTLDGSSRERAAKGV